MASKYRPRGKISDYTSLTAEDVSKLSDDALRGIVQKLNDAANKRINRVEKSGFRFASPAYRERKGKKFDLPTLEKATPENPLTPEKLAQYRNDLKTSYMSVRNFLNDRTSDLKGTRKYAELYKDLLDPSDYDKRYKKKKVLRKSGKKKIRDFWENYEQWKEIDKNQNPDKYKGDTNINYVEDFEDELYNKGLTSNEDMTKKAREDYATRERQGNGQSNPVQPATANGRGTQAPKQAKHKIKGNKIVIGGHSVTLEKIDILGKYKP